MQRAVQVFALAVALMAAALAEAQHPDAYADLIPVVSGQIDAGREAERREMCLRGRFAYVLVFRLGAAARDGSAAVGVSGEPEPAAALLLSDSVQTAWAWEPFTVDDYTCFTLIVRNGYARVYPATHCIALVTSGAAAAPSVAQGSAGPWLACILRGRNEVTG